MTAPHLAGQPTMWRTNATYIPACSVFLCFDPGRHPPRAPPTPHKTVCREACTKDPPLTAEHNLRTRLRGRAPTLLISSGSYCTRFWYDHMALVTQPSPPLAPQTFDRCVWQQLRPGARDTWRLRAIMAPAARGGHTHPHLIRRAAPAQAARARTTAA